MADEDTTPDEETITPRTDDQGRNVFGKVADEAQPQPTTRFEIDFDPDEFDSDSPKLGVGDAIRILTKRMPLDSSFVRTINSNQAGRPFGVNTKSIGESYAELARKVAILLPDELMTRDALENMDLRPALQQVMMAPAQSNPDGTSEVNGIEFTDTERQIAGLSMVTLTEQYKQEWETTAADRINEGLDVEKQTTAIDAAVQDALYGYREGRTVRIPDPKAKGGTFGVDAETGQLVANGDDIISQGVEGEFNAGDFDVNGTESIERRFWSATDIERMLAGGEITIDTLRSIEQADIYGDPTATDPNSPRSIDHAARVNYTDETRDSGNKLPDHLTSQRDIEKDWYTVTEALALPGTFSPEERVAVVKKLENAGFLEKGAVVGGDTTSDTFKTAWKNLAQSALERGVSMTAFLEERTQTYQETVMSSFATRLTDPARLKISGNTIGRSTLGRKLTDEEHSKMIEFVHGLERRNAMTAAGLDVQEGEEIAGVDALDEGITADIDARMEEWIKNENGAEAEAHGIADQYEQFTRMLAGPGRGVSN